ncbi:hypothetical protein [Komagataeibacter xylinus]|uniref:hypothetical protein n=1 Tax=Komagataeibacter xylinus TaxID=28448 RepID=UPI0013307C47|nr:hypothetical protein [Komagataeibacter xylinus]
MGRPPATTTAWSLHGGRTMNGSHYNGTTPADYKTRLICIEKVSLLFHLFMQTITKFLFFLILDQATTMFLKEAF